MEEAGEAGEVEGEGDELEEAFGVGAGGHVEGLAGEVDGAFRFDGEGVGAGDEVVGVENAFLESRNWARSVAGRFVRVSRSCPLEAGDERRERTKDGGFKELALLETDMLPVPFEGLDLVSGSGEVEATGEQPFFDHGIKAIGFSDVGQPKAGPADVPAEVRCLSPGRLGRRMLSWPSMGPEKA